MPDNKMPDNGASSKLMQAFFSPAILLMNRLGVTRKFALLGMMSLVAIAVVMYSLFASLDQIIGFSQRELKGLDLIRPFPRAVQALQQHRGLSAGVLGGDEAMRGSLASMEKEAARALGDILEMPFPGMASGEASQYIRADWERLRKDGLKWAAAENFAAHTRLIERVQSFEGTVADEYALTLDSELDTYYLIDTIVNKLPHALEHLGRLRAYGTGILAEKHANAQQRIEMNILIAELDDALAMLKINLDKTGRYNPALQDLISAAFGDIAGSARQIAGVVTSDILAGRFSTSTDDFFEMSTAAVDRGYMQLYGALLPMAETLIKERIARAENTLRVSIGVALLLFVVVAYFSIGTIRAIVINIRSLARSAHAFAGGDLDERISLGAHDELGRVGESFNEMAAGFSVLLKASRENEAHLHDLSVNLEKRVKERTVELEFARQLTEAMLRRNQALMMTSMDGVHIMDVQGNILEANDAFCNMLGYTREEMARLNVADWDAQYPAGELRARLREIVGRSAIFETVHRRKDGTLINVEISASGVDMDGHSFISASSRDITLRKQAEAALKQHKTVIDTAMDGFWMTDMEGTLLEANEAYAKMSGYPLDELVGMHISQLEALEQSPEILKHIEKIIAQGYDRFETRHRRKDGQEIDIDISATHIVESRKLFVFCRDITERKRVENTIKNTLLLQQKLMDAIPSPVFYKDAAGIYIGANKAFEQYISLPPEQFIGKSVHDIAPAELAEKYDEADRELLNNSGLQSYEAAVVYADGTRHEVIFNKATFTDYEGKVAGLIGVITDITERKQLEQALQYSEALFHELFEHMSSAVAVYKAVDNGADFIIYDFNSSAELIENIKREQVIGKRVAEAFPGVREFGLLEVFQRVWSTGQPEHFPVTLYKDKRIAGWRENYVYQLPTGEVVAIYDDVTEQKQAEEQIHSLAFYDVLTKLPNRRLFLDRFNTALTASVRQNNYGAVLFIDLDRFKLLNDTLGHDYGDLLLVEVAARIKSCVREMDTVARLGGDEFVVLIESISSDQEEASHKVGLVAEKIRESLARPYHLNGHEHLSSPSIGVSLYRGNEKSVDELLQHADMAMYQAKESGRNAVRFFDPVMQDNVAARAALVNDLRGSIERRQLHLYYQLQVDNDNRPVGAEALLRWAHPQRGTVLPEQFLPIAEESTLILDIGDWVLETACRQLALWEENEKMRDLLLTVNISAKQFAMPDFVDKIADALRVHRINPTRLKLELTESMALDDLHGTVEKMHALKALGVCLSMDDFGTRYSSLSNLKQLPLDQIKLGRSFVQDVASDGNVALLVQSIIDMSSRYRITVIAEGVENKAQLASLKDRDCVAYQGFLFSKAVPVEEFERLLGL